MKDEVQGLRRRLKAWLMYRIDRVLEWPPSAQLLLVGSFTALIVLAFAALGYWTHTPSSGSFADALWWSLTRFADGGTMAADPPSRRLLGAIVTGAGILTIALLTAAITSKMGERIGQLRSGLLPVVTRDHVLVLGFAPNTPLLVRELARSKQRMTVVLLAVEEKERVEVSLRAAKSVAGQRIATVVRTGDPRQELALVRVAAERARSVVVIPPASLSDAQSVHWTLGVLLALHRVLPENWAGNVIVEARHDEMRDLLDLAVEPGIAGPGALPMHVVAADRLIAQILAQSTRQDGVYFVLRHLLAFDGCEIYLEATPPSLVGMTFDAAHARVEGAILIGVVRGDAVLVCPPEGDVVIETHDRLVLVEDGRGCYQLTGELSPPRVVARAHDPQPSERIVVLGRGGTLLPLLTEFARFLPTASTVKVLSDQLDESASGAVARASSMHGHIAFEYEVHSAAALAHDGSPDLCAADAIVILGEEDDDDENGDASALAMLLRMRKALRKWAVESPQEGTARLVTEVRDPRSAVHVEPRPGDTVVSSDVVAMLLAQGVLDPKAYLVYDALLDPEGTSVVLHPRSYYLEGEGTFGDVQSAARAQGEVALGIYPDPRPHPRRERLDRRRLEEGDTDLGEEAWLNPPRSTAIPEGPLVHIAVLARVTPRR